MISYFRPARGWAVVVLLSAVALTLAGCGRKGGLDLPSSASGAPAAPSSESSADAASHGNLFNPSYGSDAPPQAAKGQKKAFVLDPLLGDAYNGK